MDSCDKFTVFQNFVTCDHIYRTYSLTTLKHGPQDYYGFLSAPSRPPSNLTGQATSSSSLTLAWKPVDDLHINGVLRGYDIVYWITLFPDTTRENVTIPVTSGRTKRAISDSSSPSFELSGLKKYTEYTIQVMALTVDYGIPSHEINLTTGQDGTYGITVFSRYVDCSTFVILDFIKKLLSGVIS